MIMLLNKFNLFEIRNKIKGGIIENINKRGIWGVSKES